MNWIYVIQDKDYSAVAGVFDEPKAIQMCKEKGSDYSYRAVPFYYSEGIEITTIAGPIAPEYLQKQKQSCPICNGSGAVQQTDIDSDDCRRCNGTGTIYK